MTEAVDIHNTLLNKKAPMLSSSQLLSLETLANLKNESRDGETDLCYKSVLCNPL